MILCQRMELLTYRVELEPAEEGGFVVHVPTLDLHTQGETYEEAIAMAKDVIHGHLALLAETSERIPREPEVLVTLGIQVNLPARA